jgi:hypothetical protein
MKRDVVKKNIPDLKSKITVIKETVKEINHVS